MGCKDVYRGEGLAASKLICWRFNWRRKKQTRRKLHSMRVVIRHFEVEA